MQRSRDPIESCGILFYEPANYVLAHKEGLVFLMTTVGNAKISDDAQ